MSSHSEEKQLPRQPVEISNAAAKRRLLALFERLAARYVEDWGEIPEEFALRLELYVDPQDVRSSALVDTLLARDAIWPR